MTNGEGTPAPFGRKAEATRSRIVEAAARLLVEEGPDRLTHRRAAAVAKVAVGSTTRYFAGIDELKHAGYERLSQVIDEDYRTMIDAIAAAEGDVEAAIRALYSRLEDPNNARADIALRHACLFDPKLHAMAAEADAAFEASLADLVGREQAQAVSVFIDGLTLYSNAHDGPPSPKTVAKAVRALLSVET